MGAYMRSGRKTILGKPGLDLSQFGLRISVEELMVE
jgi:hypothetical protein